MSGDSGGSPTITSPIMGDRQLHILAILTWRCQNKCPYCWELLMGRDQGRPPYDDTTELHYTDWLSFLRAGPPAFIDLSGGEPMLFEQFIPFIRLMSSRHLMALSTNLQDTEAYKKLLWTSSNRLVSVTCSWHKYGSLSPQRFVARVLGLIKQGLKAHVNIVDCKYYDLEGEDREIIDLLKKYSIPYNVSPFENPAEVAVSSETYICNAGLNTFTVLPNGDAYRCLTWLRSEHRGHGYLGNIKEGTLELYDQEQHCHLCCEIFNILDQEHSQPHMFSTYVRRA